MQNTVSNSLPGINSFKTLTTTKEKLQETISPGISSTVPGMRPKAIIYNASFNLYVNYRILASYVVKYLTDMKILDPVQTDPMKRLNKQVKVAVITALNMSAEKLSKRLGETVPVIPFYVDKDKEACNGSNENEVISDTNIISWIQGHSGILVTNETHFRGCEADVVIWVSTYLGGEGGVSARSGITRGIAHLCVIAGSQQLDMENLGRYFDIERVEDYEEDPEERDELEIDYDFVFGNEDIDDDDLDWEDFESDTTRNDEI